jgi:3'-phosphoadenosine 5'-phosphosulfate sulfotransferase (PAPS reductase)/FAD synthetase
MLKKERVCKDCYIQNVGHRFKNTLLRYCRVQKDFPNLVAVSGGSNSMAMLHLIWMCLSGNKSQKKMFFKVHVLYIDETSIYGVDQEEAARRRRVITDACD